MNTVLQIKIKNIYGTEKIYPANECAKKMIFNCIHPECLLARIAGTTQLTESTLINAKKLGYTIEQVLPSNTFNF